MTLSSLPGALGDLVRLDPLQALYRMDRPRYELFIAGLEVFRDNFWYGSGLNSFMVETALMRVEYPILHADSPANLFIGILSDTGVLGALALTPPALYYLNGLRTAWQNERGAQGRLVVLTLPLTILPGLLVGYQIVLAEFCLFILIPWLVLPEAKADFSSTFVRLLKRGGVFSTSYALRAGLLPEPDADFPGPLARRKGSATPACSGQNYRKRDGRKILLFYRSTQPGPGPGAARYRTNSRPISEYPFA